MPPSVAAGIPSDLVALLRRVEKPGRYVGGEYGTVRKTDAALTVALSYPDLYEIGMSNSAVRILYNLLNGIPDVACERVFAPAPDFEAALKAAGMPLCSLESATPLSRFDLLGFSFGYELTLTNLLAILETGGISLGTSRRGPGEPIVIVGGPAATNPAPLGPFVDAVFIGEAEGWIRDTFPTLAALKRRGAGRSDLLAHLHGQPSIWHAGQDGDGPQGVLAGVLREHCRDRASRPQHARRAGPRDRRDHAGMSECLQILPRDSALPARQVETARVHRR